MISEKTKAIIKRCKLSGQFIDKLKRDYAYKDGYYKKMPCDERTNLAVCSWYDKMMDNRRKLLGSEMLQCL